MLGLRLFSDSLPRDHPPSSPRYNLITGQLTAGRRAPLSVPPSPLYLFCAPVTTVAVAAATALDYLMAYRRALLACGPGRPAVNRCEGQKLVKLSASAAVTTRFRIIANRIWPSRLMANELLSPADSHRVR